MAHRKYRGGAGLVKKEQGLRRIHREYPDRFDPDGQDPPPRHGLTQPYELDRPVHIYIQLVTKIFHSERGAAKRGEEILHHHLLLRFLVDLVLLIKMSKKEK